MSSSKITLTGFTEWMEAENDDLWAAFDDLPTGIDKDTLVQNILLRGGEFEVIYSNPYFMQEAMVPWVTKWSRTIEKWITALAIEYDPLSNYDRTEQWTDTGTGTRSGSGSTAEQNTVLNNESMSSTNGETNSITNAETASHVKDGTSSVGTKTDGSDVTSGNTVNEVSAFDAGTYQPHNQSIAANSTVTTSDTSTNTVNGETGSDVSSAETNETRAANASETRNGLTNADRSITNSNSENSATNDSHYGRIFGNIGVTTSQQMLQSELDIAMFNLYDRVTDLFLAEFIIPIYY